MARPKTPKPKTPKPKTKAAPEKQAANRRKPPPESTRFKPGQSGNPGGRPKGRSITALIREALDAETLDGAKVPAGRTVAEALAAKILAMALAGDLDVIGLVMERTEGKVAQGLDVTAKGQVSQTVFYLPGNGRDAPAPDGDPAASGPTGDVPLDPG